jgi:hypothetical protein
VATRRLRLERTLGPLVVDWIEANLCHGPGDVQGQPIELDDEQTGFILRAYEVDDRGKRIVRRAVFSRPKGRAKSELAAMLACTEALGPVRFNAGVLTGGRSDVPCRRRTSPARPRRKDRRTPFTAWSSLCSETAQSRRRPGSTLA